MSIVNQIEKVKASLCTGSSRALLYKEMVYLKSRTNLLLFAGMCILACMPGFRYITHAAALAVVLFPFSQDIHSRWYRTCAYMPFKAADAVRVRYTVSYAVLFASVGLIEIMRAVITVLIDIDDFTIDVLCVTDSLLGLSFLTAVAIPLMYIGKMKLAYYNVILTAEILLAAMGEMALSFESAAFERHPDLTCVAAIVALISVVLSYRISMKMYTGSDKMI